MTKQQPALLFLNNLYLPAKYEKVNGRTELVSPDKLVTIYKNQDNDTKEFQVLEEPEMKFYFAKDDLPHAMSYLPRDKVEEVRCKYKDIPMFIAEEGGLLDDYWDTMRKSPYQAKMKYHLLPFVFESDLNIQDYYKGIFLDKYTPKNKKLTKFSFDIEVDGMLMEDGYVGFPDEHDAQ